GQLRWLDVAEGTEAKVIRLTRPAEIIGGSDEAPRPRDPTRGPGTMVGGLVGATLSPDGTILLTAGNDLRLSLWELATARPRRLDGPAQVNSREQYEPAAGSVYGRNTGAFSPDGCMVAVRSYDGGVGLYEVSTGKERGRFTGQRDRVTSLAFAPDGKTLATASKDTTVVVWDVFGVGKDGNPRGDLSTDDLKARWTDLASEDGV